MKKLVLLSAIAVSTLFANPATDVAKATTDAATKATTEAATKAVTDAVAPAADTNKTEAKAKEKASEPKAKK